MLLRTRLHSPLVPWILEEVIWRVYISRLGGATAAIMSFRERQSAFVTQSGQNPNSGCQILNDSSFRQIEGAASSHPECYLDRRDLVRYHVCLVGAFALC